MNCENNKGVDSYTIALILSSDTVVISNWKKLLRKLGINDAELESRIQHRYNTDQNRTDLLDEIIRNWISKNSQEATFEKLDEVLRSCEFNNVAGKLLKLQEGDESETLPLMPGCTQPIAQQLYRHQVTKNNEYLQSINDKDQESPESEWKISETLDKPTAENTDLAKLRNPDDLQHERNKCKTKYWLWCLGIFVLVCIILTLIFVLLLWPKIKEKPSQSFTKGRWINFFTPVVNFVGREKDIRTILGIYESRRPDSLNVLLIVGPISIGKSELARMIGNKLHTNANIVGFNCTNLETEVELYMKAQGENCTHLFDVNCVLDGQYNTIFIFDGLDSKKSQDVLDLQFKWSRMSRPSQNYPFVIITSRNTHLNSSVYLINLRSYAKQHLHELIEYGSLTNVIEFDTIPWLHAKMNRVLSSTETKILDSIKFTMSKLDATQFKTPFYLGTLFSFFGILSQPVIRNTGVLELLDLWRLILNYRVDISVLHQIFMLFAEENSIITIHDNDDVTIYYEDDLITVVGYFLQHPLIRFHLLNNFNVSTAKVSIIRWLITPIFSHLKSNSFQDPNACLRTFVEVGKRLLLQLLNQQELVTEFKSKLPPTQNLKMPCNIWDLQTAKLAYNEYIKSFGIHDNYSLQIIEYLAHSYNHAYHFSDCGLLYHTIYNTRKGMYGVLGDQVLDCGWEALRCFKSAGFDNEALNLALEIVEDCKAANCMDVLNFNSTWKHILNASINKTDMKIITK